MPTPRSFHLDCVLAATVLLVCCATPGAAQRFPDDRRNESQIPSVRTGAGASFSVQVLPPHGERLPAMLVVEMDNLSGGNTRIQSVAGDGVARFEEIPGGSYTVRLRADEYEPSEQTVFVPPATRGRSTLILTLGPRRTSGEARPNPMNPVVRAETLAVPAKAAKEFDKAWAESERRRAERAVVHLERALKIHPTYFDALTLLATQLVHLRRLPEAADAFERCLTVRPDDASTRFNLGLVALELDDRPRARHQLSKAAELDPENATAYFYIGETCFRMGDYRNAIRAYLQASQRETGHRDALLRLGICYERVREPAAARSFYRKFLGLESNGPRAELVRARLDALVSTPVVNR